MRRIADLCPGEAKTDARDAFVIVDDRRRYSHPPPRSAEIPQPAPSGSGDLRWIPACRSLLSDALSLTATEARRNLGKQSPRSDMRSDREGG